MRNSTKLKTLLLKFNLTYCLNNDELFELTLIDKQTFEKTVVLGKSNSEVLQKAYSVLLKSIGDK